MPTEPSPSKSRLAQARAPSPKERVASTCVCCGSATLRTSPAVLMPFVASRVFGWEPVTIDASWGLKTIAQGNAYSLCKTLQCLDCGLVFLDIRFSPAELALLYQDYRGTAYIALRDRFEPGYRERNQLLMQGTDYHPAIEDFLTPHLSFPLRILDWGGDTGKNTPFQQPGNAIDIYDIGGTEVVPGARRVGKAEACQNQYDLIVCSNVLEHVPYPLELLADIQSAMLDSTVLYLEVPLEDVMKNQAAELPACKRHWHEHVNFFSEKSLLTLLEACQLKVLHMQVLDVQAEGKTSSLFQLACMNKVRIPIPVRKNDVTNHSDH